MNYKIDTITLFDKQAKRLAKKYPSLKKGLENLVAKLEESPFRGDALGNNFYKIRLALTSKEKANREVPELLLLLKLRQQLYSLH